MDTYLELMEAVPTQAYLGAALGTNVRREDRVLLPHAASCTVAAED